MKKCPNCGAEIDDSCITCPVCGGPVPNSAPRPEAKPASDGPTDHTAEYSAADISENKVIAMLPYLFDTIGILIAIIAAKDSPFTAFHTKQALKLTVISALVGIITGVLAFTLIVPIAGGIAMIILLVLKIMGFFYVCKGQAKEIPIICNFNFLK